MSKKSYISEEDIENIALNTLEDIGYELQKSDSYTSPNKIVDQERDFDHTKVLLWNRLLRALKEINPGYDEVVYISALRQFERLADNPDLMINNHHLHQLIIGGAKVKTQVNGEIRTITLYPIDFKDVSNNNFLATNQYTIIQGNRNRRPDVTLFINGLPLVTFEFKNADNENIGIQEAFSQLETYKAEIQNYMQYNEILVISDGINARAGSLTAGIDRFMRWRAPKNVEVDSSEMELEILIKYMLNPSDLLRIIENFIIFETNGDQTIKVLAAYHQYYMVNKAIQSAKWTLSDPSDKRIGVVWHTTGSGKSLSMVFFAGIAARKLKNPTILVLNDRNDLDEQLFQTFSSAHDYLQQEPDHADNRDQVRNYLSKNSGGIIFSTIQKFMPDSEEGNVQMPILNNRSDVIVMVDEAHRTQYGFNAKLSENGVRYGYAKYLRDALPNASFIGFTGTPIDSADKSTIAVFGNYIDVYDITQAVNDHATVRIYYESHLFPLKIKEGAQEQYDSIIREAGLDYDVSSPEDERHQKELTKLAALAGTRPRLKKIAEHFVNHFESRQEQEFGKSLVVEMTRENAVKLYDEIVKLRPDWDSDDINHGKIKIVMTSNASDGEKISRHKTSKQDRLILQNRMKNDNDDLQIVIVVDMWLTGFDVPSMNTMYIDKPMKGHTLIQAIARVNRVFKDKDSGLVVDYIGIAEQLKLAMKLYSDNDQDQIGINIDQAISVFQEKYEIIKWDFLYGIDYSGFDSRDKQIRVKSITKVSNELMSEDDERQKKFCDVVTELQKAYSLVSNQAEVQEYGPEVAFFKAVKVFIIKIKSNDITDDNGKKQGLDFRLKQLLDQSVIAEPNVDIYKDLGLERPNLDIISEEFLNKVGKLPEKNLAIKMLEKLLKGKVKFVLKVNLTKGRKFQEELEDAVENYNQRGVNSELVIRQLIGLAQDMNKAQNEGKDLGLSAEEIAFYDALSDHKKAVEVLGEKKLHLIAAELVKTVKSKAGVDWQRRRSVKAEMRIAVKRLLRKYGYPPDIASEAVAKLVEQTEKMASNEF